MLILPKMLHTSAVCVVWIVTGCNLPRLSRLSRWLIHLGHLWRLFLNMSVCSIWLNSRSPWSRTLERKRESALRFKGPRHIQRASTSEYWHANDVQLKQQKPQLSACTHPQWPLARALTLLRPDMCRLFHTHTKRRSLVESALSPSLVFPFFFVCHSSVFHPVSGDLQGRSSTWSVLSGFVCKKVPCWLFDTTTSQTHWEGGQRSNHLGGDNPGLLEADAQDADLSGTRLAPRWSLDRRQKMLNPNAEC